ncbi:MAG: hypothetical protein CVU00_14855 [Bacteroidetes bacterium HGW-Bacteroidetes-17]|nr:MAG: hypothetical protein CVU00_14855 [Bacteroidetes bacterium HGW-Bacteroidetes-17]
MTRIYRKLWDSLNFRKTQLILIGFILIALILLNIYSSIMEYVKISVGLLFFKTLQSILIGFLVTMLIAFIISRQRKDQNSFDNDRNRIFNTQNFIKIFIIYNIIIIPITLVLILYGII